MRRMGGQESFEDILEDKKVRFLLKKTFGLLLPKLPVGMFLFLNKKACLKY